MTMTITVYRNGKFTTEDAPTWWEEEVAASDTQAPEGRFGAELGANATVYNLGEGRGRLVIIMPFDTGEDVWTPTTADYFDLLTTRVPALIGLAAGQPSSYTLELLANAVVSFARHGHGGHINRFDGTSSIDAEARRRAGGQPLQRGDA